jgi:hypothetical protein
MAGMKCNATWSPDRSSLSVTDITCRLGEFLFRRIIFTHVRHKEFSLYINR